MTQHPLKDITFVHCTEKPRLFPSETNLFNVNWTCMESAKTTKLNTTYIQMQPNYLMYKLHRRAKDTKKSKARIY